MKEPSEKEKKVIEINREKNTIHNTTVFPQRSNNIHTRQIRNGVFFTITHYYIHIVKKKQKKKEKKKENFLYLSP